MFPFALTVKVVPAFKSFSMVTLRVTGFAPSVPIPIEPLA